MTGSGGLRLPNGPGRPEPASRLIGLASTLVVLGLCTGLAGLGLRTDGPAAAADRTTSTVPDRSRPVGVDTRSASGDITRARLAAPGDLAVIAEGVTLPDENSPGWAGTNWDVVLCPDGEASFPSLARANDVRVVTSLERNPRRVQLVAVAADVRSAQQIESELLARMRGCRVDGRNLALTSSADVTGDQWNSGVVHGSTVDDPDDEATTGYLVVARAGRAVVASALVGRSVPRLRDHRLDPGVVTELQGFTDAMAPQVCAYREGGCYTAPPPVYSPPPGSVLRRDHTYQLPDGAIVAADGTLLVPAPQPEPEPVTADPGPGSPPAAPASPSPAAGEAGTTFS